MSIKIAFGSLLILCGLYFIKDAVTQSFRGKSERTSILYPVNGVLGVAAGGLVIAHTLFS